MESLSYSLNATVPVFLVIVLGYLLRQIGLLNEEFVRVSNNFNFKVTLPTLLFHDMANSAIRESFDPLLVGFCAGCTTVMFFGIWFLTRRFLKDKSMAGAFVQASYRSSVAILAVAFLTNIYGDAGLAPQMILGAVPLFNIYAVLVLTLEGPGGKDGDLREGLRNAARGIVTNPILIGVVLGMLFSVLGLTLPPILDKTVSTVGALATPQALICIGAGFEGKKAIAKLRPTIAASAIKLLVLPAVFVPAAIALGLREQALLTVLILLGTPTTPSCYVMAKNMGGDEILTSSVVVCTTVLSAFTLTFWLFLFRQLGYLG